MDQNEPKPQQIKEWQTRLVAWFEREGQDYPWRRTVDPYPILVSELMLQQTQIATVLEKRYFENWLERFPDLETLAAATEDEVLKAWEGLGYYNRARHLQKAARLIIEKKNGIFPESYEEILELPGVGSYTAGALLSFAFDRRAPIVDGNVIRVVARAFHFREPVDTSSGRKKIESWAELLTPPDRARHYNSAIMELGQQVCRKGAPACTLCPVSLVCASAWSPIVSELPAKGKLRNTTQKTEWVLLSVREGKVLLERESGQRRKGLWRLPEVRQTCGLTELGRLHYSITRYKVEMIVYAGPERSQESQEKEQAWFALSRELPALGSPYLKAIRKFSAKN